MDGEAVEAQREKWRQKSRKRYARTVADPEKHEAAKAKKRERHHRRKEDPEKLEVFKVKTKEYTRKYYEENRETILEWNKNYRVERPDEMKAKAKEYSRQYQNDPENLLKSYKTAATRRGLSFTISDQFAITLFYDACHYCHKTSEQNKRLMGIDRVNNDIGYELGNVLSCCKQCNRAKRDDTLADFVSMCTNVARFHGGRRFSI